LFVTGVGSAPGAILITVGASSGSITLYYGLNDFGNEHQWDAAIEVVNIKNLTMLDCHYLPIRTEDEPKQLNK